MKRLATMCVCGVLVATAGAVSAEPAAETAKAPGAQDQATSDESHPNGFLRPGFGARVGGYGFRHADGEGVWDNCRMNGVGVFGTLDLNRHVFGEVGLDFYSAAPETNEQGLDRVSTHGTLGVGFRMLPDFIVSPYAELGGGVELTRIEALQDGEAVMSHSAVYPVGYIGFGLEINATDNLKLGGAFRMLATTLPVYGESQGDGSWKWNDTTVSGGGRIETQSDFAAQAQLFVRYAL
ncbi:MAG: outer membrane beta-barrel protein [Polyangiaceae bacterium]|nr:outer membrane beta-barrel protein [Myxococcales bacterium]MCB9584031.1 outer membrane beta-barrel protein [Polyangiaceae bacterium]